MGPDESSACCGAGEQACSDSVCCGADQNCVPDAVTFASKCCVRRASQTLGAARATHCWPDFSFARKKRASLQPA